MSNSVRPAGADPATIAAALEAVRRAEPLVQCLTNTVVTNWTANVLLATGMAVAMVDNPHEAGAFAGAAGGVLVNLGTPQDYTVAAMREAVRGAAAAGTPWVLDPVAVGALPWRTAVAGELLELARPAIIRGNASEIAGLAGAGTGGRGVDSTSAPEEVLDVARDLAGRHSCVVAVSGPVDHFVTGDRVLTTANGHEWLTRVTGVGCALGALMAGFVAAVEDPLIAAAAATATLTVAAERAAAAAPGLGSFAAALLDELTVLTPRDLRDTVRVQAAA